MRSWIRQGAVLLAASLVCSAFAVTVAALETPAPTVTITATTISPAVTPPTAAASPSAMASPAPTASATRVAPPSLRPTATAARIAPTAVATPDDREDEAADDEEDSAADATPVPWALIPTPPPPGAVRAFRTPERETPLDSAAPQEESESEHGSEEPEVVDPGPAATRLPDRPYVGTVTFHAVANVDDVQEFDLMVIYPRTAGDFVGSGDRVDCRTTGDATLFADDRDDGMLRVIVTSNDPLTFPFDVICHFSVDMKATLYSGLIAVNVLEVTAGGVRADPSALTVTIMAH